MLAALFALLLPAPASAEGAPVAWQRKALALAQRVWHPACGKFRIQWSSREATGVDGHTVGWAVAGDCSLYLPWEKAWLGYPELCDVVLHEGGHATGLGHSDRGIMRPVSYITFEWGITQSGGRIERWDGVDRRCLSRSRQIAGRDKQLRRDVVDPSIGKTVQRRRQ